MKAKKIIDIASIILLFIGMFFAFLPHAFHAKAGFGESSHTEHVIYGMIAVVVALAILIYNNKALKLRKQPFGL